MNVTNQTIHPDQAAPAAPSTKAQTPSVSSHNVFGAKYTLVNKDQELDSIKTNIKTVQQAQIKIIFTKATAKAKNSASPEAHTAENMKNARSELRAMEQNLSNQLNSAFADPEMQKHLLKSQNFKYHELGVDKKEGLKGKSFIAQFFSPLSSLVQNVWKDFMVLNTREIGNKGSAQSAGQPAGQQVGPPALEGKEGVKKPMSCQLLIPKKIGSARREQISAFCSKVENHPETFKVAGEKAVHANNFFKLEKRDMPKLFNFLNESKGLDDKEAKENLISRMESINSTCSNNGKIPSALINKIKEANFDMKTLEATVLEAVQKDDFPKEQVGTLLLLCYSQTSGLFTSNQPSYQENVKAKLTAMADALEKKGLPSEMISQLKAVTNPSQLHAVFAQLINPEATQGLLRMQSALALGGKKIDITQLKTIITQMGTENLPTSLVATVKKFGEKEEKISQEKAKIVAEYDSSHPIPEGKLTEEEKNQRDQMVNDRAEWIKVNTAEMEGKLKQVHKEFQQQLLEKLPPDFATHEKFAELLNIPEQMDVCRKLLSEIFRSLDKISLTVDGKQVFKYTPDVSVDRETRDRQRIEGTAELLTKLSGMIPGSEIPKSLLAAVKNAPNEGGVRDSGKFVDYNFLKSPLYPVLLSFKQDMGTAATITQHFGTSAVDPAGSNKGLYVTGKIADKRSDFNFDSAKGSFRAQYSNDFEVRSSDVKEKIIDQEATNKKMANLKKGDKQPAFVMKDGVFAKLTLQHTLELDINTQRYSAG